MPPLAVLLRNALFLPLLLLGSILFTLGFTPACLLVLCLLRGRALDSAMRVNIWYYGRFCIALARVFFLDLELHGRDHAPPGPVLMVVNHRGYADSFFAALPPYPDTAFAVRAWPFRMPVLGWFMRRAGYLDLESLAPGEWMEQAEALARRGASLYFFPEGHRSRDGRLQPFRSGAFRLAARAGLPVLPVVVTGTERFTPYGHFLPRPARLRLGLLEPLDPEAFPPERRAQALRRRCEQLFREALDEPVAKK